MSNRMPMSLFAVLAIYLGLLAGGAHAPRVVDPHAPDPASQVAVVDPSDGEGG